MAALNIFRGKDRDGKKKEGKEGQGKKLEKAVLSKEEEEALKEIPDEKQRELVRANLLKQTPAERKQALQRATQAAEIVQAAAGKGEKGFEEALTQLEKVGGVKIDKRAAAAQAKRIAQDVKNQIELQRTGGKGKKKTKESDSWKGETLDSATLARYVQEAVDMSDIVKNIKGYHWLMRTRPGVGIALGVVGAAIKAIAFQLVAEPLVTAVGGKIGYGTVAHFASEGAAVGAIEEPNLHTKNERALRAIAEGRPYPRRLPSLKTAILAGALVLTGGAITEVGSNVYDARTQSDIYKKGPEAFKGEIDRLNASLSQYVKATAAVKTWVVEPEAGKYDPEQKKYVPFSPEELEGMRLKVVQALQAAGFSPEQVDAVVNRSITGHPGKGKEYAFRKALFDGVFDEAGVRQSGQNVETARAAAEAAFKVRDRAGMQQGETLDQATSRIINEFLHNPDVQTEIDASDAIVAISQQIAKEASNPVELGKITILGAAPTEAKQMAPYMQIIKAKSSRIGVLSEEILRGKITRMFDALNEGISTAGYQALTLPAPGAVSIDTSPLAALELLLREKGIDIAVNAGAEEAQRNLLDNFAAKLTSVVNRFWITDEKVVKTGELLGGIFGHGLAEHMKSSAEGVGKLAGMAGLKGTEQWLNSIMWGKYEAYLMALMIEFADVLLFAVPVFISGRRQRKQERNRRERLLSDEDRIVGELTAALNRFRQRIPGFTKRSEKYGAQAASPDDIDEYAITPDLVKVALRVYAEKNNPANRGKSEKGFWRKRFERFRHETFARGPVPEQVGNWRSLRETLLKIGKEKDYLAIREIIEIIFPGALYGMDVEAQYEARRQKGENISTVDMQALERIRKRQEDIAKLGHMKFRIGVFEGQEKVFATIRKDFGYADDKSKREALEKIVRKPKNVLDPKEWEEEETEAVANYLWASSVVQRQVRHIEGGLWNLRKNVAELEKSLVEVQADFDNKIPLPQAFDLRPARKSRPYGPEAALEPDMQKVMEEALATPNKPALIRAKSKEINARASQIVREYSSRNPTHTIDLVHVYGPDSQRMEYRLTVSEKGKQIFTSTREDDLLDPQFIPSAAADRIQKWLKGALNSGVPERVNAARLQKYLGEQRKLPQEPIILSGGRRSNLERTALDQLGKYYEIAKINSQRDLARGLKARLDEIEESGGQNAYSYNRTLETELDKIEKNPLQRAGIPSPGEVERVFKQILSEKIPPSCAVGYDVRNHEVVISPSGILSRLRNRKEQRIPVLGFTKEGFEKALQEVA